jgi:hypothetical protein
MKTGKSKENPCVHRLSYVRNRLFRSIRDIFIYRKVSQIDADMTISLVYVKFIMQEQSGSNGNFPLRSICCLLYVLMTAEAEGLARGTPQIVLLVALLVAILSVKGMAGDANNPSLVVKKHVRGDLDRGDALYRMGQHRVRAMVVLMARVAYAADVVPELQRASGKGKADVALDARRIPQTAMRRTCSAQWGRREKNGKYETGGDHRLKDPICFCMDWITPAMF